MPEEILAIIIISIVAGTLMSLIRMILSYKERTRAPRSGNGSLTTSELERMMTRILRNELSPIESRLEGVEEAVGSTHLLPEADKQSRIRMADTEESEDEAIGAARTARRV